MRHGAVRVVFQRRAQMLLLPASCCRRTVRGTLKYQRPSARSAEPSMNAGIEPQHRFQFLFDRLAVFQARASGRTTPRACPCCGAARSVLPAGSASSGDRLLRRVHAAFEERAAFRLAAHGRPASSTTRASFQAASKLLASLARLGRPDLRGLPRAGQMFAIGVQVVGVSGPARLRTAERDIQYEDAGSNQQLLPELGEDPDREGLRDTPKRVEKALRFLTSGYRADIDSVLNNALFTVDYSEMVIVKDIDFYSLCEHHLLPFFGKCHVAYIPSHQGHRPEQDSAARRRVQPPAAGAGAADEPDRRHHQRENRAARRRGGDGSDAPVHVDARRRETEFVCRHERDARRLPQQRADANGVPRADQIARGGCEFPRLVGCRPRRVRSRISTRPIPSALIPRRTC